MDVCFAWFSQMLNFWIDGIGVPFNGICVRFLEVYLIIAGVSSLAGWGLYVR